MESKPPPPPNKRTITSVHIKEDTKEFLQQNGMTAAYLITNAPEWRQRMIQQGEEIKTMSQKVSELEAQNYRLLRENLQLIRFKNKVLEEKYGFKDEP